jgi:hypothetical protein
MKDGLTVRGGERGVTRIFRLDMSLEDITRLTNPTGDAPATPAAVAHLLGLDWLDEEHFEIFDVADVNNMGLADYLAMGNDIPEEDIAPDRAKLDAVEGHVLMIYSRAFQGSPETLRPSRQLEFLGAWQEPMPGVHFEPLPSDSAKGVLDGTPDAATSGRSPHMTLLLALLALPTTALIIGVIVYGVMK